MNSSAMPALESTDSELRTGIYIFQGSIQGEPREIRTTVSYQTIPYLLFPPNENNYYKEYPTLTIWMKPVPKPRETQRDRWAERPSVMRFRFQRDVIRKAMEQFNFVPSEELGLIFYMKMPKMSKVKTARMCGTAHKVRPDLDNMEKAIVDSLYQEDSVLHRKYSTKTWSIEPRIEIYNL